MWATPSTSMRLPLDLRGFKLQPAAAGGQICAWSSQVCDNTKPRGENISNGLRESSSESFSHVENIQESHQSGRPPSDLRQGQTMKHSRKKKRE